MKTFLITGATGFLGSNITRYLIEKGHPVYATYRNDSNFGRCKDFYDSVYWINIDNINWEVTYLQLKIDILIHTAWTGVSAYERDDWNLQLSNFTFAKKIFQFAKAVQIKKIISLGSQAEYGIYNEKVNEEFTPDPFDAYGAVKLLTLYFLKNFAVNETIDWYWIRVFSVFGTNENPNWLLPSVIHDLLTGKSIELTQGKQQYDYLHSDEFVVNIYKIVECGSNYSGVYNLCSGIATEIQSLLLKISCYMANTTHLLKFGSIAYRKNQNMYMVGNNKKFENAFGPIFLNDMDSNIQKTINLYKD